MQSKDTQQAWQEYCTQELARLSPILKRLGIVLEDRQPHTAGERHLTGSGGRKLVLLGHGGQGRVVIKASSDAEGIAEMEHEHRCREVLEHIGFAYQTFLSPKEIFFGREGGLSVSVTEFIDQDRPFLERPVEEQFALALKAFKAQESAHATTASHLRLIRSTFGQRGAQEYVRTAQTYTQDIAYLLGHAMPEAHAAAALIEQNRVDLERYSGFLTHWDFMPQNFRVRKGDMYLLDHYSIHFGNKYEGWARFVNFMELYNPPLARALVQYVRNNRAPEELLSLKLMRAYRLLELIRYYATWLSKTSGDLHDLAQARITFWSEILRCVLHDTQVPEKTVESYKKIRDALRSEEEKERQKGLH